MNATNVTIKFNEAKAGIELHFTSKPDEAIRTVMKENGFRYSAFAGCWYVKRSDAQVQFAQNLCTLVNGRTDPLPKETVSEPIVVRAVNVSFQPQVRQGVPLNFV